jgi:hypothetical protein
LWVNLFIASELNASDQGLRLRQETQFPDEAATTLTLSLDAPRGFALHLRHPSWVPATQFKIRVNGDSIDVRSEPSSYAVVEREWRDGDRVEIELPMHTRLERLPDGSDYAAVMHGPILLAAKTGDNDLDGLVADGSRMGHAAPGPFEPLDAAPMLVGDPGDMTARIQPVPGKPLHFTAANLIRPNSFDTLELEPFFRVHDARYMMYWRVASPDEYEQVVADLRAGEQTRLALDRRTVDLVIPGEQQPEVEHNFAGGDSHTGHSFGRSWRAANDWFAYELNARGESNLELQLTHWGHAWTAESFTVELNGTLLGTVSVPGNQGERFVTETLTLPAELVAAAENGILRLTFRPAGDSSRVPPIYEVRLVRPDTGN